MTTDPGRLSLFEAWASTYDTSARGAEAFPLAGYDAVLRRVLSLAEPCSGASVLDLGTGTGNLAGLFSAAQCLVWATDFSPAMILQAKEKSPKVTYAVAKLQNELPHDFPVTYDCIVSAYALHHLRLEEKLDLIHRMVDRHLAPDGQLVLADVSFETGTDREQARKRLVSRWDEEEFYWAADETLAALESSTLDATYEQVSFCAGIFSIRSQEGSTRK